MECTIKWAGNAQFIAETGSGHAVVMEGAAELGGNNHAPRPMEMILAGAGGCTAYDVVLILKRGRHAVTACEVKMHAERADTDPKVFTKIHYHYIVSGQRLKAEVVERAIKLSADKYCSASFMLGKTAEITHDFEIQDSDS
ncbi:MAG: OsmC family protein [Uliginosibacterium sp.]|jgi:putative redox protein|nr:OsmC family protein [Uliginosibacterium sp.]MBK9616202.1 OsmC family protein [Uliginosibacterium sp.]